MARRFQQSTRKHTREFRRRIGRHIEPFATNGLLALFGAIFPTRLAIFNFELFLDRRFHVIAAVAFVFGRHSGSIELPSRDDVIAATAIVVRIFSACGTRGVGLHGLITGGVALD
ncbi:MAG: hypothetical protein E6L07_12535 [Verrucomicrobia bacterium]|nr:MAG: hypothetical protein E6L07_12535 [Verrucomicrobiota bacterium]